ncbi:hypothetical protein [Kineococcus sp. SYSU DK002]|uniref:hypothetical protein n=1 Tax=Kineococcus sp. SYSU DK002 TaxID=3383123 RepID=UPI003D7E2FF6
MPNHRHLIDQVARLTEIATDSPHLAHQESKTASLAHQKQMVGGIPESELTTLGKGIAVAANLDPSKEVFVRQGPGSRGTWPLATLAHRVLARARVDGPEKALEDFIEALAVNRTEVMQVAPIWGLRFKDVIQIDQDLFLYPWGKLPRSSVSETVDNWHQKVRPSAAIVRKISIGPVVSQDESFGGRNRTPDRTPIESAVLCCTLVTDKAVAIVAEWYQGGEDDLLVPDVIGGYSFPAMVHDHQFEVTDDPVEEQAIQPLIKGYFNLKGKANKRASIALRRVNESKSRTLTEDVALDLGIALEALLFPQQEGEISYKLRMRGAFLASNDPTRRKEVYNLLNSFYGLRSKSAHGDLIEQSDASDKLRLTRDLVIELTKKVILHGSFPDESYTDAFLGVKPLDISS